MGNAHGIMEHMDDQQRVEQLRKEGLLCDELLQMYYSGEISRREIQEIVMDSIDRQHQYRHK